MAKPIKFDLLIDGNTVKTFEELQDKAAAIAAIDLNQPDLYLLLTVQQLFAATGDLMQKSFVTFLCNNIATHSLRSLIA